MTDTISGDTVPRLRQAQPLTPFAAGLHRMAAFITEHGLPEADVAFLAATGVVVDVTGHGLHVRGRAKQWADALGTALSQEPSVQDGRLWLQFDARGYTPDLTFVHVVGRQLIAEAVA